MIVKDILPSEPLREFIQHYRLRHFLFAAGTTPPPKPFPPRPEQSLTFYVRGFETARYVNDKKEIRKPRSVLSGQFTQRVDRYVSFPEVLMVIVDFKPGALYRLMGIPFTEFVDTDLDAELVFSPEIRRLNDRLADAISYTEMLGMIEHYFLDLVSQSKREWSVLDRLFVSVAKDPDYSIDQLARIACLSIRQLERKFNERIGISPKTFLRISRFNQSYWMHLKNPGLNWFEIAMACGYTDYQHMVKAYKDFSNVTPSHLFREEKNAPGRLLGLNK